MLRTTVRLLVVLVLFASSWSAVVQARPRTKRDFVTAYPKTKGTRIDACQTCHVGVTTELNSYGTALKKAGLKFAAVEKDDSDGDKASNRKEIDALSFPGDAKDKPGARRDSAAADGGSDSTSAAPDTSSRKP